MLLNTGLGFVIGIILALTGAGGGILAVPMLMFGAELNAAQAGPIGLMAVGMAAALGAIMGLRSGIVRYKAALLIAISGMIMTPFGLWLAHHSDNRWLTLFFAMVLLYVSLQMIYQSIHFSNQSIKIDTKHPPCICNPATGKIIWTTPCARALGLSGVLAGFLSGLLGVGGGFVLVPALQRGTDLAMKSVVATSLAVIALVSATGVASSAISGHLNWVVALPFSLGALIGMLMGRVFSSHLSGPRLQQGFGIIAALIAIGMIAHTLATNSL